LSGSPDLSSDRALHRQVVSQVPALRRSAVCHAPAAAMAATIRAATRSACHQPSVSHRARAVSQQAGRRPDGAESAVALQCPAGHPPAAFGISQRREDNEADTSRRQGDARCSWGGTRSPGRRRTGRRARSDGRRAGPGPRSPRRCTTRRARLPRCSWGREPRHGGGLQDDRWPPSNVCSSQAITRLEPKL
jgi:hypothetical protein